MSALTTNAVVAVVGAGTMGQGIAEVAAAAGHPVLLFDVGEGAAEKALAAIRGGQETRVAKGKQTQTDADALCARIVVVDSMEGLADAGLVIEAIVEDLAIKQALFRQLETLCAPDTILATNTSSISVTAIASALEKPGRLAGMHFFNPAPVMKLVEIVGGLATDRTVARCLYETAVAWGKTAVNARSTPGFIVNRVARPYYAEALRVLQEQGADEATIDAALTESGGFRMGPLALMDLIGHDVNFAVTNSVYNAYFQDPRFVPSLVQQELVEAGRLGRKSGRGFYDYAEDTTRVSPINAEEHSALAADTVQIEGQPGILLALADRIAGAGITVVPGETADTAGAGVLRIGEANLMLSDGRSATLRSSEDDIGNLVLIDLAGDYAGATRAVVAAAWQCADEALRQVVGTLQKAGFSVSVIDDIPGLIVMRTVVMLINEAAEAVLQGVASIGDIDLAMTRGVNYPRGPLAWADAIGIATVVRVLDGLQQSYGEDRYRCSRLLKQYQAAGRRFYPREKTI
ncbi:MAG: 3-hydroxyacyl-CoA dehydrogenase PaaC [Gammaproteobacteria bacterium]|nr:3-hydroxyacyl-CoA dehydrogenase PaaC [Gammaproteobacteria bacterium]